eukprot:TRINITY_DN5193_c1_g2_i1.p1 TRINITY_DN5193_c1_g2~~TRINITY_DN5193_c1_g2_i1.p1  ORF type:complete len:203 (-),score=47.91 TRINITY_DN5193_c1_g2_i1:80-688(-)
MSEPEPELRGRVPLLPSPSPSPSPQHQPVFVPHYVYPADGSHPFASQSLHRHREDTARLYKTELCRSFMEAGTCAYGAKCQFAHGLEELRPVPRHPLYKTEVCKTFHTIGTCRYGTRCRFIHLKQDALKAGQQRADHAPKAVAKAVARTPQDPAARMARLPPALLAAARQHAPLLSLFNPCCGRLAVFRDLTVASTAREPCT